MKMSLTGKGGAGKTTLTALLALAYLTEGKKVLAVDADPDGNLGQALGVPGYENITPLIEMKDLIQERTGVRPQEGTGARPGEVGSYFKLNPRVDDIPDRYAWQKDNLKFLVMGIIKKAGGGCACPENVFLKSLIDHLILERDEIVLMDMPAGLEHLGRATAQAVDMMLIVVEPGQKSIDSARRILNLAQGLGLKRLGLVANKLRGEEDKKFILEKFKSYDILGYIPFSLEILKADRENKAGVSFGKIVDGEIKKIMDSIRR